MIGVGITVELSSLAAAQAFVTRLEHIDEGHLLTNIAAIGEMQTRRRIEEEKTAPDGTKWPPNREGTSILLQTGEHLRDSIASNVSGSQAEWGSSWEYAHVHQEGMTIHPRYGKALKFWFVKGGHVEFALVKSVTIPKREFVGLSAENGQEIEEVVTDYLQSLLP